MDYCYRRRTLRGSSVCVSGAPASPAKLLNWSRCRLRESDSCGLYRNHVLDVAAHWRHLANTTERSVRRGNAAVSNTFDHVAYDIKASRYRHGGGETICPPPMAVRLAADLRPSADGSAVRTWLSYRQPACLQPRTAARPGRSGVAYSRLDLVDWLA